MKTINGKYNLKRDLNYNDWMLYIYQELIRYGIDIKKENLLI